MAGDNDLEYYVARERQSRELADSATDPSIKKIHLDMAERYASMQANPDPARPRLSMSNE